jgi:GNAT superfamily N-acetyltransferase
MIRFSNENDIEQIFSLFKRIYQNHSIIEKGEIWYLNNILNGNYIGFVFIRQGDIVGHAGIQLKDEFNLINCLAVDKNFRGKGIAKKLFEEREECCNQTGRDFTIGYSMMQHPFSQSLYSDKFKPIGMIMGYKNIYNKIEDNFNLKNSNAEMILCKKTNPNATIRKKIPKIVPRNRLYELIIQNMGISPRFANEIKYPKKEIFLGLNPDEYLFNFEFLKPRIGINFNLMYTTNDERENFKNEIRKMYESSLL